LFFSSFSLGVKKNCRLGTHAPPFRYVEGTPEDKAGRGPDDVLTIDDYRLFARRVVEWIYDGNAYGYTAEPTNRGHVLRYTKVMRYLRLTHIRTRAVTDPAECEPPTWAVGRHHIFTPGECVYFSGTMSGHDLIEEPDVLVDLDAGRASALQTIDDAFATRFFNSSLEESAIEIWTHNPQTQWSARLRMLFVFNVFGEVIYEGMRIFPVRLYPYGKAKDYFVMTLQILYMLCLAGFLVLVLLRNIARIATGIGPVAGLVNHFTSGWNLLDWFTTTMGFVGMISHFVFVLSGGRDNLLFNTEKDFTWSWIPAMSRYLLGIVAMFYSWKTLQYFDFDHNVGMLVKTLKLAWNTLTFYAATIMVVLVGYAIGGNIIVGGTGNTDFLSFSGAFQSCLQITTGAISLGQILPSEASHPSTKAAVALWYWTFIVIVFFVLVNLFIAVILDAYSLLADPSIEAMLSYNNFFLFVGEGLRVLKQTVLTFVLRRPNGRITALAEKMAFYYAAELDEAGKESVSLVALHQRLGHYPGGENLIEWLVATSRLIDGLSKVEDAKVKALRKEARALKRKRRAEMLEKFGVAI
jgi:hypothetical protein